MRPVGVFFSAAALALAQGPAHAFTFSVGPGAFGAGAGALCALGPDDVCISPGDGTNATFVPAAALGLGVAGDDIDAWSLNVASPPPPFPAFGVGFPLLFSVAAGAAGPGLPVGVAPGNIYSSAGGGSGALFLTAAALGLAAVDDVDGFDEKNVAAGGAFFFSLAPGSPSLVAGGLTPGDIFLTFGTGAFGLFINAESLGLCTIRSGCPSDDNLDAMIVNTDAWMMAGLLPPAVQTGLGLLFSVGPGAIGPGLPGGTLPGDVLVSAGGGVSALYAGGAALGLAAGDDLDALGVVPEPGTALLVGLGIAALAAAHRSRRG